MDVQDEEWCSWPFPAVNPGVVTGVKTVIAISSSISMAAACWIILTFFLFKDLRTTARQLLVNLSIADIFVAGSHFVGAYVNYERLFPLYKYNATDGHIPDNSTRDALCVSQAAVTMFSSIASFLWTMSIAVYMLALALSTSKKTLKRMVVVMYLVSWGVPIPFVVTTAALKKLGVQLTGEVG